MADKQCSESDKSYKTLQLGTEITSVVSTRLCTVFKRLTEKQILNVLCKRKKKWRKKEGRDPELDCAGLIRQLGKEKEALTDITEELRDALVTKRKEGIESARQMERGRTLHSLHVLIDRSKRLKQELHRYRRSPAAVHNAASEAQPQPSYTEAQERLLQDLEKAITKAHDFRKLTVMKFHMTPRPPAIHRRNFIDDQVRNGFRQTNDNSFIHDHHAPSDSIPCHGASSEKLNEYLLEVQLPTIAQTIEATSEELNFAAEMQKVTIEQRHNCDDTECHLLEETLGDTEEPEEPEDTELLKLVSVVKNLPKDTRS